MFLGQGITWTLTALTLALLPRYLGPGQMGALGISLSFSSLGTVFAGLGIATLVTRDVARDPEHARELLPTAVWVNVAFGAVAAAVAIGLGFTMGYGSATRWAIVANCVIIPSNLLTLLGFSALQGAEVMRYQAVWDSANKLLFLLATALIIVLDLGFGAYLVLAAVAGVLVAVPAVVMMYRVLPFRPWHFSFPDAKYLVVASLPFSATNIFLVVYLAVDALLLSVLSGEEAVGIYTAPSRIFGTLLFAPTIVTTVVFPRMAASARHDPSQLPRLARTTLELVIGVTLPVTLLTMGTGNAGLVWLIGNSFKDSGPVVVLLALSLLPTAVNMVGHRILIAVDRQKTWTLVIVLALGAKVAVGAALIPLFDRWFDSPALGAAASLLVIETAMMLVAVACMPHGIVDRASALLYGKLVAGAALAAGAMYATAPLGFVATGVVGAAVYAGVVFALRAYVPAQLRTALGWLRGRGSQAPAVIDDAPPLAPREPLLFSAARFKANRASARRRAG